MSTLILLYSSLIYTASATGCKLNLAWEKVGVSRNDYELDIKNRTTAPMRRAMADFIQEKMTRDLYKTGAQLRGIIREKEVQCKNYQTPEDTSAPRISTRLSETQQSTLRFLLKQFGVIKNSMKSKLDTEKVPEKFKECKAVSRLFDSGQQTFDFSKEFHLCSWMTQNENLEYVKDLSSPPEVAVTTLADILLLLTDTGAVSEFLMEQYMKDLQEYEKTERANQQRTA